MGYFQINGSSFNLSDDNIHVEDDDDEGNDNYRCLDNPGTCVYLMFDFSRAFDVIQPHILSQRPLLSGLAF